jgi:hypothetical protein
MRIAIPGQRIPKSSVRFHASIPGCACAVSLEEIRRLVTPATAALDEKLAALQGHVDRIASDVHRISHNLHPSTVAHLGLVPALRRLCREFSDRMQLSVDFVEDGSSRRLPEEVAVALLSRQPGVPGERGEAQPQSGHASLCKKRPMSYA